jgi:hypothetical protein
MDEAYPGRRALSVQKFSNPRDRVASASKNGVGVSTIRTEKNIEIALRGDSIAWTSPRIDAERR